MAKSDPIPKRLLCDVAFDEINRRIITMHYGQGQTLHEKQLIEELGIGRTPIREALPRLAACGILDSHPNGAWTVRPITLQHIKAIFEALEIMEMGVIGLAMRHDPTFHLKQMQAAQREVDAAIAAGDALALVEANHRFHMHFYDAAHNEYLVHGLCRIRFETKRLAYISYSHDPIQGDALAAHYQAVKHEHAEMMDQLAARDEAGLRETCRVHTAAFRERIIRYLCA
jgi:DNA-binding GntR family transcriptional regulator